MDKKKYLDMISKFKARLMKKIDVSQVILFGSRARGDYDEDSDFDLIIVSDDFEGIKSFERAKGFYLSWDFEYPVDFVCVTNKELESRRGGYGIIGQALREGVEI